MLQDVRFGLRLLARHVGFTVAAVVTLALGIGANAAIFSVAWQMLIKPLPYPDRDRLVHVWEAYGPQDSVNTVAPGNFHDWEREARSFDAIAAYSYFQSPANLTGVGEPEQLQIRYVTGSYFRVFRMAPLVGRGLDDQDATIASHALVLSEGLWRRRFAADRAIVGREIRLADEPHLVVGVMPAAFEVAAGQVDGWAGLGFSPEQDEHRLAHYLGVVGRLKPDVTLTQAISDVKAVAARAAARFPESNGHLSATVRSIQAERGGTLRAGVAILTWAAGFVLLIACANLASLQLARGVSRAREFGIRAALGASRARLVAQLLTESVLVSALGAGLGLLLSAWLLKALADVAPDAVRQAAAAGMDGAIVAYAVALALASATAFATAPAWQAATRATTWLRQRGEAADRSTALVRTILVTAQIALAIILLVGATELVASLVQVLHVDPGFDPTGVLAFEVSLPQVKYDTYAKRAQLLTRVSEEVGALPGVTATCAINEIPFQSEGGMTYVPEGQDTPLGALPRTVTPGCFDVLRIRLERGRMFRDHESTRVGMVTDSFARAAWPGQDPVGRRVHLGVKNGDLIEIVGVVADSLQRSLESTPYPQFYEVASEASAFWPSRMLVRATVPPASLFSPVRAAVRRADPDQPVARLMALEDVVGTSVSNRRFDLALIVSFAVIALLLAAVGLYGLLAQIVAQRTGEIGIRLALGASSQSVVRLVMLNAWLAVSIGLVVGTAGAIASSRLLRQQLFGVSPTDPWLYAGVASALAAVALGAAWWPARRAARIDPIVALRN